MKEFIICSAIYYNDNETHIGQPINLERGFVITGRRHSNCYATAGAIIDICPPEVYPIMLKKLAQLEPDRNDQGFITNLDRYVNRKEAMKIAKAAKQLINPSLHEDNDEAELTSEDLFLDIEI